MWSLAGKGDRNSQNVLTASDYIFYVHRNALHLNISVSVYERNVFLYANAFSPVVLSMCVLPGSHEQESEKMTCIQCRFWPTGVAFLHL